MSYEIQADKDTCERSRVARGFSSFKDWRNQNRKAAKEFRSRATKRKTSKDEHARLIRLADALDVDFMKYVRHNL